MNDELTVKDVLSLVEDRVQWMREEGETDLRDVLWIVNSIRNQFNDRKTRDEILAYFATREA